MTLARTMMRTIVVDRPYDSHLPIAPTTPTGMKAAGVGTAPAIFPDLITQAGMMTIDEDALPPFVAEARPEAGGAHFTPDSRAENCQKVLCSLESLPYVYALTFATGII